MRFRSIAIALAAVCLAACGAETTVVGGSPDTTVGDDARGGGDDASSPDVVDSDTAPTPDVGPGPDIAEPDVPDPADALVGLRIEPPEWNLALDLGAPERQTFTLIAQYADGHEEAWDGESLWFTTRPEIALVTPSGEVTATASRGGTSTISATVGALRGTAEVRVHVSTTVIEEGLGPEVPASIPPGSDPAAPPPRWAYPEDGTVVPGGMVPPLLQWHEDGNTLFHLRLERAGEATVDVFTTDWSYQPTSAQWGLLASEPDADIRMTLRGMVDPAGTAVGAAPVRSVIAADADLAGSVYYWQVQTGDIMHIADGAIEPEPLFSTNADSGTCRGCHTMTRDGGRLGFMYNGGGDPRAGLAWVDEPEPAIVENFTEFRWDFLAFDPSGTRAAAVYFGDMWLADTTPGLEGGIANLGPISVANEGGRRVTTPAWSPDGARLLFINRDPGGVDWSFSWGDLMMTSWDPVGGTFGPVTTLLARGDTPETDTISYPSWSPDSRFVAYSQGPDNRGTAPATIRLLDIASGATSHLARANPAGQDVLPSFSPYRSGGYYWLLFYSTRPYGRVTTNKQLWVTAISADMAPGEDGSHPAFWLPGQDPTRANITGYWSPPACTNTGDECKTPEDCCSGLECLPDVDLGIMTCQATECTPAGFPCGSIDECCLGLDCRPNLDGLAVCQLPAIDESDD